MYLNLLNYSNLAYGPEAAAQIYFGKSAADLTLAEASYLAGIPQQPANFDPYRNFDATRRRQRIVLDLMVRHGYLTTSAADAAYAKPLVIQDNRSLATNLAPHFVQYVVETVDAKLGAGYMARAGLNIQTTLDLKMQQMAQQLVTSKVAEFRDLYDLSNAAMVAMRPNSGEILVMVGSADFADATIAGQVNVTRSLRQPGSAIKPVLYAAALDANLISPATVLWDTPITYTAAAGEVYAPFNYDRLFHGPVTARVALANSYNIPTVKLLDALGIERMLATAKTVGITSLNQSTEWYGLSLALGGGEITPLDLTTAFHTFASAGNYWPATPLLGLTDSQDRPLYLEDAVQPVQALKPETAFLISDMLSDNVARTPAFGEQSPLRISRPAAVKTGTTNDYRDNWTVGYTRHLVVGVWAGNSDGRPMRNTSGVTGAAPIWHDFMEMVLSDPALLATYELPTDESAWQFTPPPGIEQRPDCPPGITCRAGGEYFTTAWIAAKGTAGVLADSTILATSAPVYVQQGDSGRLAGFCQMENAVERQLLRVADPLQLADVVTPSILTATPTSPPALAVNPALSETVSFAAAYLQTLAWTLRNSTLSTLDLGACDRLEGAVEQAFTLSPLADGSGLRVLVDVAAATNPAVGAIASEGSVDVATLSGAVAIGTSAAAGQYAQSGPIVHDNNCPGSYIMGLILNREGAPVADVAINLRDSWGNQAQAYSKQGALDYGMFDFPIASGSPHELYITIVDGSGNPLSAPITVPHGLGEAGDAPCHHIVVQGG